MIFTSKAPDVEIPNVSLPQFLRERTAAFGAATAIVDGPTGRSYTFTQLHEGIRAVAAGLHARGFGKGDVFAIYSPNLPEYALMFFGVATLGGINTTASPLYTAEELAKQLNDSGAKYLITVAPFLENAQKAAAMSKVEEIFVFGEAEGATPFTALLLPGGEVPEVAIDPMEDLVVLPYSSGTTGVPKGVMLTHRNLVANIIQTEGGYELTVPGEKDTILAVLPFFHIYGMVVIMSMGLCRGVRLVTMPKFEFEDFLTTLEKYEVTAAYLVPPIMLGLAKHPAVDNHDLSKLKWVLSGAAPLGGDMAEAVSKRLNLVVTQGYGLTETSPVTHAGPDTPNWINSASAGMVVPNTEVKVVDLESGKALGVGEQGEIWMRGPQVMKGYLGKPEETAACIDAEGFFHSGDIGYADEDGYFYVVDRLKELIKYKGFQVPPAELEALLLTHPDVMDVAVIPSPDEEAGEVPKAFIVRKPNTSPTAEDLMAFVEQKVSPQKKVRRVEFTDQIPKSPSGKILRRLLVAKERAQGN